MDTEERDNFVPVAQILLGSVDAIIFFHFLLFWMRASCFCICFACVQWVSPTAFRTRSLIASASVAYLESFDLCFRSQSLSVWFVVKKQQLMRCDVNESRSRSRQCINMKLTSLTRSNSDGSTFSKYWKRILTKTKRFIRTTWILWLAEAGRWVLSSPRRRSAIEPPASVIFLFWLSVMVLMWTKRDWLV